jgi:hypothetical protein
VTRGGSYIIHHILVSSPKPDSLSHISIDIECFIDILYQYTPSTSLIDILRRRSPPSTPLNNTTSALQSIHVHLSPLLPTHLLQSPTQAPFNPSPNYPPPSPPQIQISHPLPPLNHPSPKLPVHPPILPTTQNYTS